VSVMKRFEKGTVTEKITGGEVPPPRGGVGPFSAGLPVLLLTPSQEGRPNVSRRCATERRPSFGKLTNISSDASRTSPTVFKPAAASAFGMRGGN
jgi:hypothetical protein